MKQYIYTGMLLLLSLCGMAQIVTITDPQNGTPLEGVSLQSKKPRAFTVTNSEGQADLANFKDAALIEIRSVGYKTILSNYNDLKNSGILVMEPSKLNLEEVVVSGTKWRQVSSAVPSKIVSISQQDVAFQNPQTAADLLSLSGKVYVQKSQQGGGSPMIRGFATNRLLYSVDGVRMNTAIFRGGNIQNVINLDPFAIENTEVLFGPGSVIYGSDAIGGVMSFQTLVPELSLTDEPLVYGKAITRYSSANNERTNHFDIGIGGKKWSSVTSLTYQDFDDLRQGSNGPDDYLKPYYVQRIDSVDRVVTQDDPLVQSPSAYAQLNLMQKIRFKPNEHWDFEYGFHFSETSAYGRYDRHNRIRNGTARYAEWNYGPQSWIMNNLRVSYKTDNAFFDEMNIRLAQQSFEESRIDRSLNSNERTTNTENVEAYSVNLDFAKNTSLSNTLFYGAEYVLNDITSTGLITDISNGSETEGPARYPQAQWSSIAAYVNDEFKATEDVTLQAGLRYNYYQLDATFNTDFYPFPFTEANLGNGALTGSIGAVYRPAASWIISANLGTAFRSPNVDDVGKVFDSEPGAVTVPNPDLEAEYAYNADLGIAKVFGDAVKLDVSGYYTILQNALVRRNFQLNGLDSIMYDGAMSQVQAIQNAAVAHVYGVQAGIEVQLPAGFSFSSDINYQVGEEELDDGTTSPSRHAAPLFGVSRFTYKANKLMLQAYATYQGERKAEDMPAEELGKTEIYALDENGNAYAPAWYTLNIKAMYQFTKYLSATAGIENITDQRYRPYSSGISAPGRNFIIALQAKF